MRHTCELCSSPSQQAGEWEELQSCPASARSPHCFPPLSWSLGVSLSLMSF
ncbi:hypothetical protein ACRRTK_010940 [Alexandromys fortis]